MSIDYRKDTRWKVYVHISPSNKYYVGITSRKNIKDRWRNGKGYIKNTYFYRAIQRYGWNNFEHEIIASNLTKDEACKFEIALIKELKSNDYHYGYNISSGGEGGASGLYGEKNPNYGNHWTDEMKQRMSEQKKGKMCGKNNPMYGRKVTEEQIRKRRETLALHPYIPTEETRNKISESLKMRWKDEEYHKMHSGENAPCYGRTGDKHPMYGKHGKDVPQSKMVVCLTTNNVYYSATDAAKITGSNHSKLCMCCRGERKSCGKLEDGTPLRWQYYNDYLKENNLTDDEARNSLIFIE